MNPKTASVLLLCLVLGAILWIALGGDAREEPAAPPPAAPVSSTTPAGSAARSAGLDAAAAKRAELLVTVRAPDPGVFRDALVLVRLEPKEERPGVRGGSLAVRLARGQATLVARQLPIEGTPAPTLAGADLLVRLPGVAPGAWRIFANTLGDEETRLVAPPAEVALGAGGADVLLELAPPERRGRLRARLVRGGTPLSEADLVVLQGKREVARLTTPGEDPDPGQPPPYTPVPAGRPLTVKVIRYRGMSLFGPIAPQVVELERGERRELVFEAPPGRAVLVRAVTRHGEHVASGLVLWRLVGSTQEPLDVMDLLAAGPDGWAGDLPPGRYRAMAVPHALHARGTRDFEVVLGGELLTVRVAVPETGTRLTLTLEDDAGRPLASEGLNLNRLAERPEDADFVNARTDPEGLLVTRPLLPGRYRLYLWKRGLARVLEVGTADRALTLRLPEGSPPRVDQEGAHASGPGLEIRGTVRDPDGAPAKGVYVHARREGEVWERMARTDARGRFAISGLRPGAFTVFVPVRLLGQRRYRETGRPVVLGTTDTTVRLRLAP